MQERILVVDDSSINLSIIKSLTERIGLKTDACKDPASALKRLTKHRYAVILSDYLMPGMNGIEFTYKVHTLEGYESVPVILLTSDFTDEEYLKFIEAGINNVLIKPVSYELLKDALEPYTEDLMKEAQEGSSDVDAEYLKLVSVFVESAKNRLDVIERAFGEKDYNTYTVEVHAVKGESAMISESELSKKALELEKAGKELLGMIPAQRSKDELESYIDRNTHSFLEMLDATIKRLEKLLPETVSVKSHSGFDAKKLEKLSRYVQNSIEAMDEKDYTLAREWLEEVKGLLG